MYGGVILWRIQVGAYLLCGRFRPTTGVLIYEPLYSPHQGEVLVTIVIGAAVEGNWGVYQTDRLWVHNLGSGMWAHGGGGGGGLPPPSALGTLRQLVRAVLYVRGAMRKFFSSIGTVHDTRWAVLATTCGGRYYHMRSSTSPRFALSWTAGGPSQLYILCANANIYHVGNATMSAYVRTTAIARSGWGGIPTQTKP